MRAKLITLILAVALTAAGLLVVRQARLQAVYDMTRSLDRAAQDDQSLWRVRAEIGERLRPERLRVMAGAVGPLLPIPKSTRPEPVRPLTTQNLAEGVRGQPAEPEESL